ncbi:endonuclease III [Sulfurimonas sp. MAG313]|nr:endonuclease III [Sulfurimonas sp. MAG313]MDF1879919.1 endonuclease III [Sulfurimonas sp. MAG313]
MKKATKKEILEIKDEFVKRYDEAVTELNYTNAFELVIAVALSAQCTDKRVNIISPALFKKYPDPISLANAELDDVLALLNTCSFFNNKGKNIIKMAQRLIEVYDGEVPLNEKDLQTLAGVGQKTAHVVLIEFLGANLMAVDTHVFRVSHRLGLSDEKTAIKTEAELTKKFKTNLHQLHQGMVLFGRYICTAKKPKCDSECFMQSYCKTTISFKPA